jgi:hypothetical protein
MICQDCSQYKKEVDNCRCTENKTYGAMYVEIVSGCMEFTDDIRCKKHRMEDSYVCEIHNKKRVKRKKNDNTSYVIA